MMPPTMERETAEIRLLRTIDDLNHRLLLTREATDRTAIRASIAVLKAELLKLIEAMPILSEAEIAQAQKHLPMHHSVLQS